MSAGAPERDHRALTLGETGTEGSKGKMRGAWTGLVQCSQEEVGLLRVHPQRANQIHMHMSKGYSMTF